jgi:hypothetical protein
MEGRILTVVWSMTISEPNPIRKEDSAPLFGVEYGAKLFEERLPIQVMQQDGASAGSFQVFCDFW